MTLEIDVITLFPAMIAAPLGESIPARIQEQGLAVIRTHDLREWGLGRHRSVDDAPYGGGAGMILRPEPVAAALDSLRRPNSTVILLDPVGEVFTQARAADLATRSHLIFVCPRYEGVDERIRALVDLGDLDRRLRADRWRAAGPRRHRCRHPAPAGCDRGRVGRRRVVRRRAPRVPAVHAAAVFRGLDVPAILTSGTTARSNAGGAPSRSNGPGRAGRTSSRTDRPATRDRTSHEAVLYSAADARPRRIPDPALQPRLPR